MEILEILGGLLILAIAVCIPMAVYFGKQKKYKNNIEKHADSIFKVKGQDYWIKLKKGTNPEDYYKEVLDVIESISLDFTKNGNRLNIVTGNRFIITYGCPEGGMKDDDICEAFIKILNNL